jgi:hypothetical protein
MTVGADSVSTTSFSSDCAPAVFGTSRGTWSFMPPRTLVADMALALGLAEDVFSSAASSSSDSGAMDSDLLMFALLCNAI